MAWYVVYCKPRLEASAFENLQNQGFAAFYPQVKQRKRKASGMTEVVESMFPRYLFVELEKGVHDFTKLRSTRGCVDLVRFGGQPTAVPSGFVDALRTQLGDAQVMDLTVAQQAKLKAGSKVRLLDGAFEGLVAEIAELKADDRALLLMEVMGGARKVEVNLNNIEPLQQ